MNCLLVVFLVFLVTKTLGSPKANYDLADAEQHFTKFIKQYHKHFGSDEEYNQRFEIFKDTLEKINYWNKVHEASFDINEFSDQDLSNFQCYDSAAMNFTDKLEVKQEWIQNAPAILDYRQRGVVTRVKNQGNICRNCYVFAAVGNIESRFALQTGSLVALSEQQATDCAASCMNAGLPHKVMDNLARQSGLMSEIDYPYRGVTDQCHADVNRGLVKVTGRTFVATPTEEALMGALAQYGPLAIGIYMSPTLHNFRGDIAVTPNDCPVDTSPNHAVLLVGYSIDRVGQPHWIIKNSWGQGYGDQGYLLLAKGNGKLCSLGFQGAALAFVS